ncbi:MAG: sigma 54-interacting transcriptional regulator [Planctomycetota bacterium]
MSETDLRQGFETFVEAACRLEDSYKELKSRADKIDLELAATNAKLAATLREREAVFSAMPVGVVARDPEGQVSWSNPEADRLMTTASESGLTLADVEPGLFESSQLAVNITRVPLPDGGSLLVLEDRSKILRLEREVHRLDRLAGLSELALGVAHEIKNPLNGVVGFASLLDRAEDPAVMKRFSKKILEGLEQVDEIVKAMLEFARPQSKGMALATLASIIREAASHAGLSAARLTLEGDLDCEAQSFALVRVLTNLFRNSLEAGGASDVSISVRVEGGSDATQVLVRDDGPGIDPELGDRIFEPFVSTKDRGHGLGLALSCRVLSFLGRRFCAVRRSRRPAAMTDGGFNAVVLVADDEPISREFLAEALRMLGMQVIEAEDGLSAIQKLSEQHFDFIFTDLQMPGQDGLAVLAEAKKQDSDRPVVLVTAHGTMEVAIEVMRKGADDILEKPATANDLELALMRVMDRARLRRENRYFRRQSVGHGMLVGSEQMHLLMDLIGKVAVSKASVLIRGESGTGKERVAAEIHRRSGRVNGPFVKINCAAIPESLMESELFGHEVGAFTGATKRREGCFELADGGTLFLDEIGEMAPGMQAKLLRVIQEGELTRVGGSHPVKVDVRIVSATNRDLERDIGEDRFRGDLFYRLNVVPLNVPPLRERKEEVKELVAHFLSDGVSVSEPAMQLLESHDWPGNVRELENLIQRACILCSDGIIQAKLIAPWLGAELEPTVEIPSPTQPGGSLAGRKLCEVEMQVILETLDFCSGNRTKAASMLGIGVRTLFNKLKAHSPQRSL